MTQQSEERSLIRGKMPIGKVDQAPTFLQLGILVLDGSGSMNELTAKKITKGQEVSNAVRDLISRFKASTLKNNFRLAVVNYDHSAKIVMDISKIQSIDDNKSFDPTIGMGGTTSVAEGLKIAKQLAETFLSTKEEGGLNMKVLILVISDGLDMTEQETVSVANSLKSNPSIQIASCFLETLGGDIQGMNSASDFLKSLTSDITLFSRVNNTESLRDFFHRSMSQAAGRKI